MVRGIRREDSLAVLSKNGLEKKYSGRQRREGRARLRGVGRGLGGVNGLWDSGSEIWEPAGGHGNQRGVDKEETNERATTERDSAAMQEENEIENGTTEASWRDKRRTKRRVRGEQEGKRAAARATAIWKLDETRFSVNVEWGVRERAAKEGETFPLRASSSTSR
ncbi:hypothetical protein VTN00DRAFT_5734 [Thermoascus crustaceus]|uniref:uncharacterized protein n=1 Tax=Thermoascus crustaceus TaxID=5088 RepID=UPI0037426D7A